MLEQGHAAFARGDEPLALDCFSRILEADPRHLNALHNRGVLLGRANRIEEALQCFAEILALDPGNVSALVNSGIGLAHLGCNTAALERFTTATVTDPGHMEAWMHRGQILARLRRPAEAAECYASVLRLDPRHIGAQLDLAQVLQVLGRPVEALMCFGDALNNLHRFPQALECYDRLQAERPRDPFVLVGRAAALAGLDRLDDALECLRQALRIHPDLPIAINNRSFIHLAQGRLPEGFRGQEVRWKLPPYKDRRLNTPAPPWLGGEPLSGRTILLHHEQGMGDTLQFVRYAPLLAQRGAKVVLRAPAALIELLRTVEGVAEVVGDDAPLPAHDVHCPIMSLPMAFGTTLQTIPAGTPYLHADPARVRLWSERLGAASRLRVGLVWAGHRVAPINYSRDIPLTALRPLLALNAEFVSLQKDVAPEDAAELSSLPVARLGESVADFADTAALIANMDLVIAAETSTVHLAGALGKPVWVMNCYAPCWRWLRGRTDSPWYPTARLFKQTSFDDWASVVDQVRSALSELLDGAASDHASPSPRAASRSTMAA
ncbi:MAG: tetratricopeptide repeat-containing glycosyltransferase family protein [Nevskia sp.]|nr:tetratricopeptide repeat-containing glycosyltransferase family protein [Nevskia sp.]